LEDNEVTLRPLAGTRKRGMTPEEDECNAKELLADPKEIAEHLMLIDLGRNDVGRVSKIGSVQVTQKMAIEKYSHVMHIVSNVTGSISNDLDCMDVLKATLPAGTLSGAPKIRAMEIINELEPSSRGIYGGAIGYISWDGGIDTAIAIRTAVIKDQVIHVGAGAGIVADSIPENEWLECKQKAKVFVDAIEMIS
jgi:anthranilate synthase component 1